MAAGPNPSRCADDGGGLCRFSAVDLRTAGRRDVTTAGVRLSPLLLRLYRQAFVASARGPLGRGVPLAALLPTEDPRGIARGSARRGGGQGNVRSDGQG